jgi:hypothetical protein
MAFSDVTVDTSPSISRRRAARRYKYLPNIQKRHREPDNAIQKYRTNPRSLVLQASSETEESDNTKDEGQHIQGESKFGFVDALVPAGQFLDRPVVQRASYEA